MKKVLVLNQFALPREQSGGTRHADLFGRLTDWQPQFVVGNRNYNTQEQYETADERFVLVPVPSYSGASLVRMAGWGLYSAQAMVRGLASRRLDLVYASTPNMLAPVAGWTVARARRVPFVVEVRDLWPESIIGAGALRRGSRLHRALMALERWIYNSADHIVVVTDGWGPHFEALGIPGHKVTVVSNGTEVSDFEVSANREDLRREFRFERLTAVYAGAHGPANALHLVLEAAGKAPHVDFVLIGSGSEKARLQDAATRDGLSNVRFLDPMPKRELARVLKAADVGIHCIEPLPVLQTGMSPNKLFDYMAAGLPTVTNAGTGLRHVVQDGVAGRTGGPNSLAEQILAVADADEAQRSQWSKTAKQIVTSRFSRTAAAHTLQAVLDAPTRSRLEGDSL